ncbi:hypothetical protein [Streptomyces sp. NPDC091219]|uniref:hypothetical protein n=1 Tax=Streptomyces sp. NPDC091219 TaxID=3155193 RepID=UPI00344E0BF9
MKLTHAGRTLYSHKYGPSQEPGAQPRIPGSGWYTITETGHRDHLPAGSLSTSSSLSLHFYADAGRNQQIRAYITRFSPEALNSRNQAASGSTTTIDLGMRRDGTGDSTIGRRVGLRSTVTDTHGDSSTTTVHNAYAVS